MKSGSRVVIVEGIRAVARRLDQAVPRAAMAMSRVRWRSWRAMR
jgi:hypothetical protein